MSNIDAMPSGWAQRLPPSLLAVAAHVPALVLGIFLITAGAPLPLAILSVGITAAGTAWLWKLPQWWRWINLLFVPGLWLAMQADISSIWYLAGFALLALTSLGAIRTRVPLYLSSDTATETLAEKLPRNARFMDLGCGLGGPLATLAKLRPDLQLHGVEAAPLNWLIAKLRLGKRAQIRLGSLWDTDLAGFDAVYAYLSPAPMAHLWEKVSAEMPPGGLFISNSFPVPGTSPSETVELHDLSHARLLIWRL